MKTNERWSDAKLDSFHQEFQAHVASEDKFIEAITQATRENTEAIANLAAGQKQLIDNTEGLVTAWNNAEAVVSVGSTLGKLGKWLGSIAVIGALFKFIVDQN